MPHTYEDLVVRSQHIRPLRKREGHTDNVRWVAFSPNGRWLASGSHDYTVHLWEVPAGHLVSILGHPNSVNGVVFSPDSQMLVSSGGKDGTVCFWETRNWQPISMAKADYLKISLSISPDGRFLATYPLDTLNAIQQDISALDVSPPSQSRTGGEEEHA